MTLLDTFAAHIPVKPTCSVQAAVQRFRGAARHHCSSSCRSNSNSDSAVVCVEAPAAEKSHFIGTIKRLLLLHSICSHGVCIALCRLQCGASGELPTTPPQQQRQQWLLKHRKHECWSTCCYCPALIVMLMLETSPAIVRALCVPCAGCRATCQGCRPPHHCSSGSCCNNINHQH